MTGSVSHDHNFKNLILDYPKQALELFASEEAACLDGDVQITPIRQEQLKERLGERFRELDVPLLVEWPDGKREALLFVLEEESDPGRFSIHRLAHYCVDLAELCETNRVAPVVIFLKPGKRKNVLRLGGDKHTFLDFHYLGFDLPNTPVAHYWDSDNLVARLNLPNMNWMPEQKIAVYAQAIKGLLTLERSWDKQAKYLDFIDIYLPLDDNERQQYQRDYEQEAKTVASFSERYIEQGRQEGLQAGMQKGMQKGMHEEGVQLLARLLQRRFGEVSEDLKQRLNQATTEELEVWAEQLLDAKTLDDVFS